MSKEEGLESTPGQDMIRIITTETLETVLEMTPGQDMNIPPETGILEKEIEDIEKTVIERTDIEKTDIEKTDIERTDIEKTDLEKTDIDKIDLEMNRGQDLIIIILIEIPEIDLGNPLDKGMSILGMMISKILDLSTPALGMILISLEIIERSMRICSLRKILEEYKE